MITKISKRDGRYERYQPKKITWAILVLLQPVEARFCQGRGTLPPGG